MALPSIQSVPQGAPSAIIGFLQQVRERLLAMVPQFTDAQATALLALLNTKPATPNAPAAPAASVVPTFLKAPVNFFSGTGGDAWASYDATKAGVPKGSTAIIIFAKWGLHGKTGVVARYAFLRIDPTKGNSDPTTDTFILAHGVGANDNNSDYASGSQQGIYPLRPDATFDYRPQVAGQGWSFLDLSVVGYFTGSA